MSKPLEPVPASDSQVTVGIIISEYYQEVAQGLLTGVTGVLDKHATLHYEIVRVFGAWEIPLMAKVMARSKRFHGLIALGCIIRGETAHFDHLCEQCTAALMSVSMDYTIPLGYGVLTVEDYAQAKQRVQIDNLKKNKGFEAVMAVLGSLEAIAEIRQGT